MSTQSVPESLRQVAILVRVGTLREKMIPELDDALRAICRDDPVPGVERRVQPAALLRDVSGGLSPVHYETLLRRPETVYHRDPFVDPALRPAKHYSDAAFDLVMALRYGLDVPPDAADRLDVIADVMVPAEEDDEDEKYYKSARWFRPNAGDWLRTAARTDRGPPRIRSRGEGRTKRYHCLDVHQLKPDLMPKSFSRP